MRNLLNSRAKWFPLLRAMYATGSLIPVVLQLAKVCSHLFELVHGREGSFQQVGFSPFGNWGKNAVTLGSRAAMI